MYGSGWTGVIESGSRDEHGARHHTRPENRDSGRSDGAGERGVVPGALPLRVVVDRLRRVTATTTENDRDTTADHRNNGGGTDRDPGGRLAETALGLPELQTRHERSSREPVRGPSGTE